MGSEPGLWKLLRGRRLEGLKFRRQVAIGKYVADFVCLRHRLIIEADGPFHEERAAQDAERDDWLRSQGFVVLRFPNHQIDSRPHEVVFKILETALKRPSPLAGEGGGREPDG
jgi:very-short-patch-repair endonuclease